MTATDQALLDALLEAIDTGQTVALVTVVTAEKQFASLSGQRALFGRAGLIAGRLDLTRLPQSVEADIQNALQGQRSQLLTYAEGAAALFVSVEQRPPVLLIVGSGHVAQPLARLGKMIDFRVVVLDDRPQYANRQRFPEADEIIVAPFTQALRTWPVDENTYVVLVTRGHSHDVESLLEVIDSPARYIGMIGSKRRIRGVFDLLEQERGISPEKLAGVYAPIGLDIGAETPAEIAICVIAEIVNLYRGGRAVSLSEALRADRRLALHPARSSKNSP